MGIVNRIAAETRATKVAGAPPRDPVIAEWFGAAANTAAGVAVSGDGALRIAAVYACVSLLARTMGTLPIHHYIRGRDGGRELDDLDPLALLLRDRPNRWQTPFEFKQMLMGHVCLRGNAYARIVSASTGAITDLVPLHPDCTMPFWAPDDEIAYRYQGSGEPAEVYLADEVLHLRGLSTDLLMGLSPIALHRETMGESLAAQQYSARFFGNNAQPKGGLKVPETMTNEDAEKLLALWIAKHGGAEKSNRPAILHSGMEWVQIGMSNDDAQFIDQRKFTKRDIAMIFGVPPHKIGDLEQATFSNIEHQGIEFVTDTMEPWTRSWEHRLNLSLMSAARRKTRFLEFDLKGLLRGDSAARAAFYRELFGIGTMSQNDIRRAENLNPIAGGDQYFVPLNMAPADKVLDILLKPAATPQQRALMERMFGADGDEQLRKFIVAAVKAESHRGGLLNGH